MGRKAKYTKEEIEAIHAELGTKVVRDFAKEKGLDTTMLKSQFRKHGLTFNGGKKGKPARQLAIVV